MDESGNSILRERMTPLKEVYEVYAILWRKVIPAADQPENYISRSTFRSYGTLLIR
jgi:hypothetical protein